MKGEGEDDIKEVATSMVVAEMVSVVMVVVVVEIMFIVM